MLGNKAPIRKQSLVNRTHLVDAEICIGNASAAVVTLSGLSGQAHEVNDAQHDAVAQFCRRDHFRIFRVKDMSLQRSNHKHIVKTLLLRIFQDFLFCCRIAVVDQVIQLGKGLVQIVSAADFRHIITNIISNVPQALQRVARQIRLCLDGRIAQLRTSLDKQHKEHTVHIPQTLDGQLPGIHRVSREIPTLARGHIIKDFIAEKLNAFTQSILQILRHPGGMLLGISVQFVQQCSPFLGTEAGTVKQDSHRL